MGGSHRESVSLPDTLEIGMEQLLTDLNIVTTNLGPNSIEKKID